MRTEALFRSEERLLAEQFVRLTFCNPFTPERVEIEREMLGRQFRRRDVVLSRRHDLGDQHPNVVEIRARLEGLLGTLLDRAATRRTPVAVEEAELCRDLVSFHIYHLIHRQMDVYIRATANRGTSSSAPPMWDEFAAECRRFDPLIPAASRTVAMTERFYAQCFQVRRAFNSIYDAIIGETYVGARLRAAVWQSIFTHDMARYQRVLFERMGDFTCLITGPSGTGKELVAQAIGSSRYIPFDASRRTFTGNFDEMFIPVSLPALSPTLIESELFGHRRGSFTGALQDRAGFLESCPALGTVFLDEIGELDANIQVKLLRLLQTRSFQRIGDTKLLPFEGKFVAATNRDLLEEIDDGRFRMDLYYRLCSDVIRTPSLREQLDESAEVLTTLVRFIAERIVGDDEAPAIVDEVQQWVHTQLPRDYPWPGNVRELEQCVRNIIIRKSYTPQPRRAAAPTSARAALARDVACGTLSAEELLSRYFSLVYAQTGSYQEAARCLGVDHRTLKAKLQDELVEDFRP